MRLFITFQVEWTSGDSSGHDREPIWRQVDWRFIEGGNGYGRDAARRFAESGHARYGILYATVQVWDDAAREPDIQVGHVHYWHLFGRVESIDPNQYVPTDEQAQAFLDAEGGE